MSVTIWLNQLQQYTQEQPSTELCENLAGQFDLSLNEQVSSLQNHLHDGNVNIDQEVDSRNLFDGAWPGFEELAKSYLRFCRDVEPDNLGNCFDLYGQFCTDLSTAFANNKGAILTTTVESSGKVVVQLALAQDAQYSPDQMLRTSYMSALLLRLFNSIRGEKYDPNNADGPVKKDIIMYVATALCRVYFKLGTPSSCGNVFSNIHTANITFSNYSKAHRVEYRYYLGRYHMMKNQLRLAYLHLWWSFDNCYDESPNKRLILTYLVPVAILLGHLPSQQLLAQFDLTQVYGPLITAIKSANYKLFMDTLESHKTWLLRRGLYIVLQSRSAVVIYRQALRILWKTLNQENVIPYDKIATAFALAKQGHEDNWHSEEKDAPEYRNVEAVLASLISQNFVKANIYASRKLIRLRAQQPIPSLFEVHNLNDRILRSTEEQWMNR